MKTTSKNITSKSVQTKVFNQVKASIKDAIKWNPDLDVSDYIHHDIKRVIVTNARSREGEFYSSSMKDLIAAVEPFSDKYNRDVFFTIEAITQMGERIMKVPAFVVYIILNK